MKLYTEEQVLKFINDNFDEGCSQLIGLTPIELPSDDEIEEGLFHQSNEYAYGYKDAFAWMRNKIQGGNNEQ